MQRNDQIRAETLKEIEEILNSSQDKGRQLYGKRQLVYASMACPFKNEQSEYLSDLRETLNQMKMIIMDENKLQNINQYFFQLYDRVITKEQNKNSVIKNLLGNERSYIQSNGNQNQIEEQIQNIIDTYETQFKNQKLCYLVLLSSLVGKDILNQNFFDMLTYSIDLINKIDKQTINSNQQQQNNNNKSTNNQINPRFQSDFLSNRNQGFQKYYEKFGNHQNQQQSNFIQSNNNATLNNNESAISQQKQQDQQFNNQFTYQTQNSLQQLPQQNQFENIIQNNMNLEFQSLYLSRNSQNQQQLNQNNLIDNNNNQIHHPFRNSTNTFEQKYNTPPNNINNDYTLNLQNLSQMQPAQSNQFYYNQQQGNYQQNNASYYNNNLTLLDQQNPNYQQQQQNHLLQNGQQFNNQQVDNLLQQQQQQYQLIQSQNQQIYLQNYQQNLQINSNNLIQQQAGDEIDIYLDQIIRRSQRGSIDKAVIKQLLQDYYQMQSYDIDLLDNNNNQDEIPYFSREKIKILKALVKSSNAMEKVKNKPRLIQIISTLSFLFKDEKKGRILQINTGEGKSIIVALVAATQALLGRAVDIVTSNKLLAERDCTEFQEFYRQVGLTAGFIGGELENEKLQKIYSKNNIVYCEVSQLGGDYLTHQHEKKNTKMQRKCDYCIVDEVDCMFIDQHNVQTVLGKPLPGLKSLEDFLIMIWNSVYGNLEKFDSTLKYIYLENENKEIFEADAKEFAREKVTKLFKENKDFNEGMKKHISPHLVKFAFSKLDQWIDMAFKAINLKDKVQYKVENDDIVIIDHDNTGQVLSNMKWGQGLHQFLQLKEGVRISPMSLSVNFISNLYVFKMYGSNIIGLTGTLGTDHSVKVLEEFYSLDAFQIPPFTPSQLIIYKPLVIKQQEQFQQEIRKQLDLLQKQDRPCLLLFQDEREAEFFTIFFSHIFGESKVKKYLTGGECINEELNQFLIIISTNIAGRGTDFKISSSTERNGGLHVIVTFLPKNKRVDYQAYGRAGRCGQKGSAQMIVCSKTDNMIKQCGFLDEKQDNILELRDIKDNKSCESQINKMKELYQKDEKFWEFSKELDDKCGNDELGQLLREQEEENWAYFYATNKTFQEADFKQFMKDLGARLKDKILNNSNSVLIQTSRFVKDNKIQEAFELCSKIIQKDNNNVQALQAISYLNAHEKQFEQSIQYQDAILNIFDQKDNYKQAVQQIAIQSQIKHEGINQKDNYNSYIHSNKLQVNQNNDIDYEGIYQEHNQEYERQLEEQEEKLLNAGLNQKFKEEQILSNMIVQIAAQNKSVLQKCKESNSRPEIKIQTVQEVIKEFMQVENKNENKNQNQQGEEIKDQKQVKQISSASIEEFSNNNLLAIVRFAIKQQYKWNWYVIALGVAQVGVGFLLMSTHLGFTSRNLIFSGIKDIINGVTVQGKPIDLSSYFSEKMLDMTLYAISNNLQILKAFRKIKNCEKVPAITLQVKGVAMEVFAQLCQLGETASNSSKKLKRKNDQIEGFLKNYPQIIDYVKLQLQQDQKISTILFGKIEFISRKFHERYQNQMYNKILQIIQSQIKQELYQQGIKELVRLIAQINQNNIQFENKMKEVIQQIFQSTIGNILQEFNDTLLNDSFNLIKEYANDFMLNCKQQELSNEEILNIFSQIFNYIQDWQLSSPCNSVEDTQLFINQYIFQNYPYINETTASQIVSTIMPYNQINDNYKAKVKDNLLFNLIDYLSKEIKYQLDKNLYPIMSQFVEKNGFSNVLNQVINVYQNFNCLNQKRK